MSSALMLTRIRHVPEVLAETDVVADVESERKHPVALPPESEKVFAPVPTEPEVEIFNAWRYG